MHTLPELKRLCTAAVKNARDFHRTYFKYKRLGWDNAAGFCLQTRNYYLKMARNYKDAQQ
jgi:hypothetical protein